MNKTSSHKCLGMRDAALVLQYKNHLKLDAVNIHGRVVAVSEVIRIKEECMFLVHLEEGGTSVYILVKKASLLKWQKEMLPDNEFIFTNFRPTTLYKGTLDESKLFVPWHGATISPTVSDVHKVSLQEWLVEKNLLSDDLKQKLNDWQQSLMLTEKKSSAVKLYSYKGVITNTDMAHHGIYELDKSIRLYLTAIPAEDEFQNLQLGTEIVVYNVHQRNSSKPPRIHLCACSRSCVHVETQKRSGESDKKFKHSKNNLAHLLHKYSLSLYEFDWLLDTTSTLKEKFGKENARQEQLWFLIEQILGKAEETLVLKTKGRCPRNILLEFMDDQHDSCPVLKPEHRGLVLTEISPIKNLLLSLDEKGKNVLIREDQEINCKTLWNYETREEDGNLVLCGKLGASSTTGQVFLYDDTGRLDMLVVPSQEESQQAKEHPRGHDKYTNPSGCTRPVLQPHKVGQLHIITSCKFVTEKLVSSQPNESGASSNLNSFGVIRTKHYIVVSAENLIPLNLSSKRTPEDCSTEKATVQNRHVHEAAFKKRRISGCQVSQLFQLHHKEYLSVKSRLNQNAGLSFYAKVTFIGKPQLKYECIEDFPSDSSENINDNEKRDVALVFQGTRVRFFHFLCSGCMYKIVRPNCEDTSIFEMKLKHQGLKKAIKKAQTTECIFVTEDMHIAGCEPSCQHEGLQVDAHILSISDILSAQCTEKLVNVRGTVQAKSFCSSRNEQSYNRPLEKVNSKLGVSVPGDSMMKLTLQDSSGPAHLDVCFRLENLAYPLGLLPGALVLLERLEFRLSRTGQVFCQFIAASDIHILGPPSLKMANKPRESNTSQGNFTRGCTENSVYLSSLWTKPPAYGQVFTVTAHILKILKVTLSCKCALCGSGFSERQCHKPNCQSDESVLEARASAIIEDGTCNGLIHCQDGDVQFLLAMNQEEWTAAHTWCSQTCNSGQLHWDKEVSVGSSDGMLHLLGQLCVSSLVLRPVVMLVKVHLNMKDNNVFNKGYNQCMLQDFMTRTLNIGGQVETRTLPLMQLSCIRMMPFKVDHQGQQLNSSASWN